MGENKPIGEYPTIREYPTITETILGLEGLTEEKRYLAIGAGVVLGIREAYQKQNARKGVSYWKNRIVDQIEEARMIAKEISRLAGEKKLEEIILEIQREKPEPGKQNGSWFRPYFIISSRSYTQESLARLGEYLERRMKGRTLRGIDIGENRNQHLNFQRRKRELEEQALPQDKLKIEKERIWAKRLLEEETSLTRYLREFYGRKKS